MIVWFILTLVAVFAVLLGSELWWRHRNIHDEFSRKFVHITVGSFVAFWPFFLSWGEIRILSLAFLIVISVSKYLHIFRAIHSVQRPTWGEIFFALAVGGVSFVTQNKWVYMAALLQMSLADGLAAVVGVRFGLGHAYKVLGHTKTIIGSTTFFAVSVIILIVFRQYAHYGLDALKPVWVIGLALAATAIENFGIEGLDNLLVPMLVALGLRLI